MDVRVLNPHSQFTPLAIARDILATPAGRDPRLLKWARALIEQEDIIAKAKARRAAREAVERRERE